MPVEAEARKSERGTAGRVVIVCSNVGNNCLGRALLLGELLQRTGNVDVRIAGVNLGQEIWRPSSGFDIPVAGLPMKSALQYPAAAKWLRSQLRGSRVIVSKPMFTSLGLTRLAGVSDEQLLLDVDDWEVGLFRTPGRLRKAWGLLRPGKINSFASVEFLDRTIVRCPHRVVSNRWLEKRYGGVVIPHVRDTQRLSPNPAARSAVRSRLQMDDRFWVGYVGTVRKHKGVDDLLTAVVQLDDGIGLYLAGVDESDPFAAGLVEQARAKLPPDRLRIVNEFPFHQLSSWLSAADVLCMPSRNDDASVGQIPAKLFDAMAMGVPILASAVNDIPDILAEGAGMTVAPGQPTQLAKAIQDLVSNAELRERLGAKARKEAVRRYSYEAASKALWQMLAELPLALMR